MGKGSCKCVVPGTLNAQKNKIQGQKEESQVHRAQGEENREIECSSYEFWDNDIVLKLIIIATANLLKGNDLYILNGQMTERELDINKAVKHTNNNLTNLKKLKLFYSQEKKKTQLRKIIL